MNVAFLCKQITCIVVNEVRVFEVVKMFVFIFSFLKWNNM